MKDIKKEVKSVFFSIIVGFIVSLLLVLIFSYIMTSVETSENVSVLFSYLVLFFGALTTGFVNAKILKQNGLVMGAVCGTALFIINLMISLIISESKISTAVLIKLAVIILSCIFGGILGVNIHKKKKYV